MELYLESITKANCVESAKLLENKLPDYISEIYEYADSIQIPPPQNMLINDLIEAYKNYLNDANHNINKLEEKHSLCNVCSNGCCNCCHNTLITISTYEAAIIKKYIFSKAFSSNQKKYLKSKIIEHSDILANNGITNKDINRVNQLNLNEELNDIRAKYYSLNLPCIFLYNNSCLIHEVKPLDCWAFRQYLSPELCKVEKVAGSIDFNSVKMKILLALYSLQGAKLGETRIGALATSLFELL